MTELKYKFDENLLKVSKSKDLETAKKEWREICTEKRDKKTGLCICQHTLMNIIYIYNIYTKCTISIGTGCCKKFNLQRKGIDNNILKNVLSKMITKGEYKIIDNILQYTKNIQSELIAYITKEYQENATDLEYLKSINDAIENLITAYDLKDLQAIYEKIINTILKEEQINAEKKRAEREQKRKELVKKRMEEEQKRKELEQKRVEEEQKRKEEEKERIEELKEFKRREKEHTKECMCGIMKKNICSCKNPNYELIIANNELSCKNCKKWKCRCRI